MKRKKVLALTLALVMAAISFAGCAKQPGIASSAMESQAASDEPITTTHQYWADSSDYSAKMRETVEDFDKPNKSSITVKAEEYPWDGGAYSENLFNAVMDSGSPDTVAWKLTSTPLFIANNLPASLDGYVSKWDKKDDIDQNIYDIMKQAGGRGEMHVMPCGIQALYVHYRPSIFKQADVEVSKTYEEFLEVIKKTILDINSDGKTDVYGFDMRGAKGGQEPWGSFIRGRGGSFEDMTTPESIQGMQDFIDLYKNGYIPSTATQDGFNEIIANFKSGKIAMIIHHVGSSVGMVETFGGDVDVSPFPADKGQRTSMSDTESAIFEACKNKEAASEWVFYLAADEGQEKWCKITGNMSVSKTVQALSDFKDNKFMKASIAGQSYAGIVPIKDTTAERISTIQPNTVAFVLTGKETAASAMKTLQEGLYGKKQDLKTWATRAAVGWKHGRGPILSRR